MIADRIEASARDEGTELSARLELAGEQQRLWLWVPVPSADRAVDASPFLAALLPLAMRLGEPLRVEGPVSPRLLAATDRIQEVMWSFWPRRMQRVEVRAPAAEPGPARMGTACFFTGGVDSWHSLLTEWDRIERAVNVPAIDRPIEPEAAAAADRELLYPDTNLRRVSEPVLGWPEYHGAALAAIGLALRPERMLVPGSFAFGDLCPWGSHPLLDHLWSTERTEVVHHGVATRLRKAATIGRHQPALDTLKVCFARDAPGNCGRCMKCAATMLTLHAAGVLDRCPRFDGPLDAELLSGVVPSGPGISDRYLEAALALDGEDRLLEAVELSVLRYEQFRTGKQLHELAGTWRRGHPPGSEREAALQAAAGAHERLGAELEALRAAFLKKP